MDRYILLCTYEYVTTDQAKHEPCASREREKSNCLFFLNVTPYHMGIIFTLVYHNTILTLLPPTLCIEQKQD